MIVDRARRAGARRLDRACVQRGTRAACAALVCAALLTACGGLSRPAPVKNTFLLDPSAPAVTASPKPGTLRVATLNVAAPFRAKQFVYRQSDLGYGSDYYDEFFLAPAAMLTDATAKALAAAHAFERVAPPGAPGDQGDYVLEGFVSALYADARAASRPAAVLGIEFYLSRAADLDNRVTWTHRYERRIEASDATPEALARAWNAALTQVLADLARDLEAASLPAP